MAKINLTAGRIADFQCEQGKDQSFLWDSGTPGLAIRATANGAKSYIFQAKINGKEPRITIGDTASWRLPEAREEARHLQVLIDKGHDPRKVKDDELAAKQAASNALHTKNARESVTLSEVWSIYLKANKAKWSAGHYQNHVNLAAIGGQSKKRGNGLTVAGPLAPLMPLLLSSLTSDKIAEWLEFETATRPTNAGQSYRILRALTRWIEDLPQYQGIVPSNAYTARKVRDLVPKSNTKEGDSLQREQLPLWFAAVKQINNSIISTYLQSLLLTGARRNELAELRWENIDFQWCKMTIGDKVEGMRTIPLTPYLSGLFATLPHTNEWVFSSLTSASGHIKEPTKAHQKALVAAGLPHLSIHGLRRSFGTLAEWVEAPVGVVAQISGHKPSATAEKHYRRREIDFLRKWHVKIENWMLEQAHGSNLS